MLPYSESGTDDETRRKNARAVALFEAVSLLVSSKNHLDMIRQSYCTQQQSVEKTALAFCLVGIRRRSDACHLLNFLGLSATPKRSSDTLDEFDVLICNSTR